MSELPFDARKAVRRLKAAAKIYGRVEAPFSGKGDGFTPQHIVGAADEALRGAVRDLARRPTDRAAAPCHDHLIPYKMQANQLRSRPIINFTVHGIAHTLVQFRGRLRLKEDRLRKSGIMHRAQSGNANAFDVEPEFHPRVWK